MDGIETGVERTRSAIASPHRELSVQLDWDEDVGVELGDERVRQLKQESNWNEWHTESNQRVKSELVRWSEAGTAVERTVDIEEPELCPVRLQ